MITRIFRATVLAVSFFAMVAPASGHTISNIEFLQSNDANLQNGSTTTNFVTTDLFWDGATASTAQLTLSDIAGILPLRTRTDGIVPLASIRLNDNDDFSIDLGDVGIGLAPNQKVNGTQIALLNFTGSADLLLRDAGLNPILSLTDLEVVFGAPGGSISLLSNGIFRLTGNGPGGTNVFLASKSDDPSGMLRNLGLFDSSGVGSVDIVAARNVSTVAVVPAPAALGLLSVAIWALACVGRGRKRTAIPPKSLAALRKNAVVHS